MGLKKKSPKGEIGVDDNNGRLRLRWRYAGERYSLNLPYAYLPENMHHATLKSTEINLDIMKGCFDPSLEKYNSAPHPPAIPRAQAMPEIRRPDNSLICLDMLVPDFNDWGKNIRNVDVDNAVDYLYVRRLLEKWTGVPVAEIAGRLNEQPWVATTYNRRLTMLQTFFAWLVDNGKLEKNPLKDVCRKRNKKKGKNPRRAPLTDQEIGIFLEAIRNNIYSHPSAFHKHSHYYPFLLFVFSTGVRNAEAIGLRVRHVDLMGKRVEISETFARTLKGSNHAARVQKGTKTENTRWLPLTDDLVGLLHRQIANKQADDFVFPSPKGLSIDDQTLQKRTLKPVLRKLGLGDRDLYAARHSFGTRAARQGVPVTDIAYLMGHTTINTAIRNYIGVTAPSFTLPALELKPQKSS